MICNDWRVLDPDFPEEFPDLGQPIYSAVLDEANNKVVSPISTRIFGDSNVVANWYRTLRKMYGDGIIIVWQPVPPDPIIPKKWRITKPIVCSGISHSCQFYDSGYCMSGPENCPQRKIHREFLDED